MDALSFPINKKLTSTYCFAVCKAISNLIKALQQYFKKSVIVTFFTEAEAEPMRS